MQSSSLSVAYCWKVCWISFRSCLDWSTFVNFIHFNSPILTTINNSSPLEFYLHTVDQLLREKELQAHFFPVFQNHTRNNQLFRSSAGHCSQKGAGGRLTPVAQSWTFSPNLWRSCLCRTSCRKGVSTVNSHIPPPDCKGKERQRRRPRLISKQPSCRAIPSLTLLA